MPARMRLLFQKRREVKPVLHSLKKHFSAVVIVLSVAAVVMIAFSNQELENAWEAVLSLKPLWVLGVFFCWAAYASFEALGSWLYLRSQRFSLGFFRSLSATMIGFFYSNVTPSAAGGQPMQVSSLRRANVPVGYGTMAVTIRFISNQFVISLLSLFLFLIHHDAVHAQLENRIWFVRIGWLINFCAVPVVLTAAFHRIWIENLADWMIGLLARFRLLQHPDQIRAKLDNTLDTYHEALRELLRRPVQILLQVFCSLFSLLGLTGSVIFVYHAFGLSGTDWLFLLTVSCLLFISASYTPLPGASGAQEGGFLLYYNGIFTDGTIGLALLVWRFFTYYLFLIAGLFFVLGERLVSSRSAGDSSRAS